MSVISKTKLRYPIAMKWSIPEGVLREMKDEPGESFASDCFAASTIPLQYHLTIYPNDDEDGKFGEAWVYMFVDHPGEGEITVDYNISIESANFSAAKKFLFTFDDYAGVKCCKTEELFDPEKRFFVDGKLTIKMDGILMVEVEDKANVWEHKTSDGVLCLNLWNQEEDKDVTIHADEKEISAHKVVLCARSPVFAKMFKSGMKEAKESKVMIEDFPFDIVAKAIQLCYHHSLVTDTTLEDKMQLLQFFDKYDIQSLKNELETFLISEVDEYSVCCLANCSLLSNSRKLQEKCAEFLLECLKESKPVANFDQLDKDFALNLLKNAFYPVSK